MRSHNNIVAVHPFSRREGLGERSKLPTMTHFVKKIGCRISPITRITTSTASATVHARRSFLATKVHAQHCSAPVWQRSLFSTTRSTLSSTDSESKENGSDPSIHTVNKEEIAKFASMSEEWWAPQGPFKMLHLMNPPRVRFIRNRLEASGAIAGAIAKDGADATRVASCKRFPLEGLSIVDIGCGGGLLSEVSLVCRHGHYAFSTSEFAQLTGNPVLANSRWRD
jgi:hypothetical protein